MKLIAMRLSLRPFSSKKQLANKYWKKTIQMMIEWFQLAKANHQVQFKFHLATSKINNLTLALHWKIIFKKITFLFKKISKNTIMKNLKKRRKREFSQLHEIKKLKLVRINIIFRNSPRKKRNPKSEAEKYKNEK